MKKILDWRILFIIILVIILCVMLKLYFSDQDELTDNVLDTVNQNIQTLEENKNTENTVKTSKILETTSEIISGMSEKVELHATYYLAECYVEANQEVKKGENILKYTNGTYLVAPYDCVITELNIPSQNEKCTNSHSISISSVNTLAVKIKVDESKISKLYIGQSVKIKVSALNEKKFEGYITKISSTASNGKFTVTVEFENDGNVKIGMSSEVEI